MYRDFIPNTWSAFADWMTNFSTQFGILSAKYGLAAQIPSVDADNAFLQYWVQAKFNAKQQEKQLTDFVNISANGKEGTPKPTAPTWELPSEQPTIINPGIKQRIRGLVRQIKANPLYSEADGALLGIAVTDSGSISRDSYTPDVKFDSKGNFALQAEFRKLGLDALKIEFRRKGGEWNLAAILTSSPGLFIVTPASPGQAEQIELRCVFIVKNQPYGNYSPTYTAVTQP